MSGAGHPRHSTASLLGTSADTLLSPLHCRQDCSWAPGHTAQKAPDVAFLPQVKLLSGRKTICICAPCFTICFKHGQYLIAYATANPPDSSVAENCWRPHIKTESKLVSFVRKGVTRTKTNPGQVTFPSALFC